jgi:iron complex transport system substrate-binding protein
MRVVSLLPGATEIAAALGRFDAIVGVTHECDHPASVDSRVRVTRSALRADASAAEIDAQVATLHTGGNALFEMFEDRIRALRPDLILTQALCDVCAVMETDVRALSVRLNPVPAIVTCSGTTLAGVFDDIRRVGTALDADDEADEWIAGAMVRLRTVHETLKGAAAPRPRVAVIEWSDPIYAAGHWMPEMVKRAGGIDVLAAPGSHSVKVPLETVRTADPEVIVIAPCGYNLERAIAEGRELLSTPQWAWARERRVFAIDANAFATRPGPRLIDGIEILARLFNPSLFSPVEPSFAQALAG